MPKVCTIEEPYPCEDKVGSKCKICGHAGRNHVYFKNYCLCLICDGNKQEEELYQTICDYRSTVKFLEYIKKLENNG